MMKPSVTMSCSWVIGGIGATHPRVAHEGRQFRGYRQGLSAGDRLGDDQVALRGM